MPNLFRILIDDATPLGRWKKGDIASELPNDNPQYDVYLDLGGSLPPPPPDSCPLLALMERKFYFHHNEVQPVQPCPHCHGAKLLTTQGPDLGTLAVSRISPCPECQGYGFLPLPPTFLQAL